MKQEQIIGGRHCYLYENGYENGVSDIFLIQPVNEYEAEMLDKEVKIIGDLSPGVSFTYIAFLVRDWNKELAPWEAPAVFGKEGFGAGAADTLAFLKEVLLPELQNTHGSGNSASVYLGGYSLAGLFALWASYQTDAFNGIAAVSPSVWFPDWDAYMESHSIRVSKIYLSLGDREEKTRNKVMARVGENLRKQYEVIQKEYNRITSVIEWNPGNHFTNPEIRMAKGFAWLLNSR